MRNKRQRGSRRKFRNVEQLLLESTIYFPINFPYNYATILLPANREWVKCLSLKGKKQLAKLFIERAGYLQQLKSQSEMTVTVMFHMQDFWHTQLIIFDNQQVFNDFVERNSPWQKWQQTNEAPFVDTLQLPIPQNFEAIAYKEWIEDDELVAQHDLLFIVGNNRVE